MLDFTKNPPRVTLYDLSRPGEKNSVLEVQFNPTEFTEQLQANYGHVQPIGMPHSVMHYQSTSNRQIPLEFFMLARDPASRSHLKRAKKFLASLLYPRRGADTILGGAPPDVLVVWPNELSIVCKLISCVFDNKLFSQSDGSTTNLTASCVFEEHRTKRWTLEDEREFGGLRSPDDEGDV